MRLSVLNSMLYPIPPADGCIQAGQHNWVCYLAGTADSCGVAASTMPGSARWFLAGFALPTPMHACMMAAAEAIKNAIYVSWTNNSGQHGTLLHSLALCVSMIVLNITPFQQLLILLWTLCNDGGAAIGTCCCLQGDQDSPVHSCRALASSVPATPSMQVPHADLSYFIFMQAASQLLKYFCTHAG